MNSSRLSNMIDDALNGAVTRVEHFGGTAIPGMSGKPIIDLLIGVVDLGAPSVFVENALVGFGYESFGEIFIAARVYLRKRGPPHFNVAVCKGGGEFWNAQLVVRDCLLCHPDDAERYSAEK